jgi:spore germination protein GerM
MNKSMKVFVFLGVLLFVSAAYGQEMMTIKVFFHNEKLNPAMEDCSKAFPTERKIPKTKAVASAALEELFKGATEEEKANGFWSYEPSATSGIVKGIRIKKGAAYVNFTKAVYEKLGDATTSCGGGFWPMVENTLTQFPTIKKVFYAIEGSPRDFYEWVQVGECPEELKNCSGKEFK